MNSKQYDFNIQLLDYDDKPYKVLNAQGQPTNDDMMAGKVLSNNLKALTKGNIIKLDDWARTVYKGQPLILDNADEQELVRIIKEDFAGMSICIKRQLLDILANGQEIKTEANATAGASEK